MLSYHKRKALNNACDMLQRIIETLDAIESQIWQNNGYWTHIIAAKERLKEAISVNRQEDVDEIMGGKE